MSVEQVLLFRGPFSLATLEHAYQAIVYGYDEPDVLRCSETTRDKLAALCLYHGRPGSAELMFNNAAVAVDEHLQDRRARFENSKYPVGHQIHERMNCEVEFTDG